MTDYGFLANLTLVDKGRRLTPKEKNPEGLTVRVFSNGEVYPSQELVEKFKLEYPNLDSTEEHYGIDVVDSKQWTPLAQYPRMILFGFTSREESKLDLFNSCRYNKDGTPKSSVMTQGSNNRKLLHYCQEMGWITEEQKYVDLQILTQHPISTDNGVAYIPKTFDRGEKKGESTYAKREHTIFYPVEPTDIKAIQGNIPTIPATNTNELVTEAETI